MAIFKIVITGVSKATVEIDADSYDEAVKLVENEYWKNPSDYVLEPEETSFE